MCFFDYEYNCLIVFKKLCVVELVVCIELVWFFGLKGGMIIVIIGDLVVCNMVCEEKVVFVGWGCLWVNFLFNL